MDRRLEPRYATDLEVRVTELTRRGFSGAGRLTNISNSGVGLVLPKPFKPGDLVRLEVADTFLFGYVVHSRSAHGGFNVGIETERVIFGDSDLSRLLHSVLERNTPDTQGVRIAS